MTWDDLQTSPELKEFVEKSDAPRVVTRTDGHDKVSRRLLNSPMQTVLKSPTATSRDMRIGTWNVEGLTDATVVELQYCMMDTGLDVLCLPKTHWMHTDCHVMDAGFLLEYDELERAGVGFSVGASTMQIGGESLPTLENRVPVRRSCAASTHHILAQCSMKNRLCIRICWNGWQIFLATVH